MTDPDLTPELMLHAYSVGVFPMAENGDDPDLFWVDPDERGILPIDGFHISRSLAKRLRQGHLRAELNRDFMATVEACADRSETWINSTLYSLYSALHARGHAHAVEVFDGETLLGGTFGISLGAAFFGESMYSAQTNGSKLTLAFLTTHLSACGYQVFDTQFLTDHLASLGGVEVSRAQYQTKLTRALDTFCDITALPFPSAYDVLQRKTQTS